MNKVYNFVVVSSVLALMSCGGNNAKIEKNTSDSLSQNVNVIKAERGDIVFVRMDSIVNNFDMYHDLRKVYEEDVTKANTDLQNKSNAFQKDAKNFQEKVEKGLITRSQAGEEQAVLERRQRALQEEAAKKQNELMEKESVLLNQIQDAILKYINKYNAEKGYSLILGTTGSQTVLYGNPGLDITTEIITGLNSEYIKNR
jgi:outer membrane protein